MKEISKLARLRPVFDKKIIKDPTFWSCPLQSASLRQVLLIRPNFYQTRTTKRKSLKQAFHAVCFHLGFLGVDFGRIFSIQRKYFRNRINFNKLYTFCQPSHVLLRIFHSFDLEVVQIEGCSVQQEYSHFASMA